jgi:hypothetical protein
MGQQHSGEWGGFTFGCSAVLGDEKYTPLKRMANWPVYKMANLLAPGDLDQAREKADKKALAKKEMRRQVDAAKRGGSGTPQSRSEQRGI